MHDAFSLRNVLGSCGVLEELDGGGVGSGMGLEVCEIGVNVDIPSDSTADSEMVVKLSEWYSSRIC